MRLTLKEAQAQCEHHLQDMEKLFKPECRLTFIMRTPGEAEAWIVMTRDDLDEVVKTIQRSMDREPTGLKVGEKLPPRRKQTQSSPESPAPSA
jgi:hypothetical protein